MIILNDIYFILGILTSIGGIYYVYISVKEWHNKAALRISYLIFIYTIVWFSLGYLLDNNSYFQIFGVALITFLGILFFIPFGKKDILKIKAVFAEAEKIDERDTMFARSGLKVNTQEYKTYYERQPEKKKIDDKLRSLPRLLSSGGKYYDELRSKYVKSLFDIEESRIGEVDGKANAARQDTDKTKITELIKKMTLELGAVEVGIAKLNPNYIYSHSARGTEPWGSKINCEHKYVIVFSVEMDYFKVNEAPMVGTTEESAQKYLLAQHISISLANYIRELSYPARAHISGSNYQIMLPPVAYDAGIGELGRMNYIISPKYGARIRLGAVTTDLPLLIDKPIEFGVQDFCKNCLKCAVNCPSGAITKNEKTEIRVVEKWALDIEQRYKYWRVIGTDCALCMKVCPFSHPNNLIHNLFRKGIKNSSFARRISLWGDDIIYGKKIKY